MLKKVSLVLSVLATFGFAVAISAPANAKEVHKTVNRTVHVNKNVHVNRTVNRNVRVRTNVRTNKVVSGSHRNFVVGRSYGGHMWFGHNRHRWHGQWYGYGEGPCWINVDGEWFWNVVACPL